MSSYRITLKDRSTEHVDDVDAYQQEGPMTTFFRTGSDRHVVDTWSTRVASFRTSEVLVIRRIECADAALAQVGALAAGPGGPAPGGLRSA
ncbi:hypothetical protein BH20ACT3_BH20ACT3_09280 [soil metagenome]